MCTPQPLWGVFILLLSKMLSVKESQYKKGAVGRWHFCPATTAQSCDAHFSIDENQQSSDEIKRDLFIHVHLVFELVPVLT